MKNIRIIKTGIDVQPFQDQLDQYPDDWGLQKNLEDVAMQDPTKLWVPVDVMQLIMGGIEYDGQHVSDSELCYQTPALYHHTNIVQWLKANFWSVRRCAYFKIPVGHQVGKHVDIGSYPATKDRYHLSISGTYRYRVFEGDSYEEAIIEPGTLFWFDNKKPHESTNIGTVPRVAFIFDVPHHPNNP
jgi:hypothetical protein